MHPRWQCHRLQCYSYTNASINSFYHTIMMRASMKIFKKNKAPIARGLKFNLKRKTGGGHAVGVASFAGLIFA